MVLEGMALRLAEHERLQNEAEREQMERERQLEELRQTPPGERKPARVPHPDEIRSKLGLS